MRLVFLFGWLEKLVHGRLMMEMVGLHARWPGSYQQGFLLCLAVFHGNEKDLRLRLEVKVRRPITSRRNPRQVRFLHPLPFCLLAKQASGGSKPLPHDLSLKDETRVSLFLRVQMMQRADGV